MKKLELRHRVVPRWVVLLVDVLITGLSFGLSYFILKYLELHEIFRLKFVLYVGTYVLIAAAVFSCMKVHFGLIRYSNFHDMLRIFSALLISSLLYPVADRLVIEGVFKVFSLDIKKILFVNFFISSSLLILLRISIKELYFFFKEVTSSSLSRVLIYGTDATSLLVKQTLESADDSNLKIIGFVDTDRRRVNAIIEQRKVYPLSALKVLKMKEKVDQLILANDSLQEQEKQAVIDCCLQLSIKVLTVPPSSQWIYGKLSLTQIKDLKIEDLLQRDPIVIKNPRTSKELTGKRVLVTGAAGSIGHETVRQVIEHDIASLILCDQAESALHEVQLELEEKYPGKKIEIFIGSIQNHDRMQKLFRQFRPEIIFHAAAYKHVPMMEHHPSEAIMTNVLGTKNIADLAVLFRAEKFVMISTDKAVNPTNVMGSSKRIAEMYIQSLNNVQETPGGGTNGTVHFQTKFITTRFGNVLGSNGSVIPRFYKQIQNGGPVTVTHPEMTRYFMTIPEAVQLVLEACCMGNGGEIFVFDMGKPVKIVDLASKMIKLAGLVPDKDIKIEFTGLRPGEKLYEELLGDKEKTIPTHHEKIKIAKVQSWVYFDILQKVLDLISSCDQDDMYAVVRKMKAIIPEFISNNSVFEILDAKAQKKPKTALMPA
jgi:FlaA1/EpsC-like NDP-sugar epimerase